MSTRVFKLYPPCLIRTSCRSHVFMGTAEGPCGPSVSFPWILSNTCCFHLTLLETRTHPPGHVHTSSLRLPLIARTLLNIVSLLSAFVGWRVSQRVMRHMCLDVVRTTWTGTHTRCCRERGTACVSVSDLFVSFHSGCLHTKRLLSPISLSISHPLLFPPSSPFPVCPSLCTCVF